jgi:S-adenosylmethionine hydrolase
VTGTMLSIDRFGNIQTNISGEMMDALGLSIGDLTRVTTGDKTLVAKFVHLYGDVPEGDPLVFVGGPGFVEVAINLGNAAEALGAEVEMLLTIEATR